MLAIYVATSRRQLVVQQHYFAHCCLYLFIRTPHKSIILTLEELCLNVLLTGNSTAGKEIP